MKDKKNEIINATIELFATRHYDGMTIPMIAKKANIGVGTMYNYFENKETLINEIYQQIFEEFAVFIKKEVDESLTYQEKFNLYYKRIFEYSSTHGNFILFLKYNSNAYYISDESKKTKQKLVNFLVEFMEEGKSLGILKNVSEALYMSIIYAPVEMLVTNAVKKEIDDMSKYFDEMLECIWTALKK